MKLAKLLLVELHALLQDGAVEQLVLVGDEVGAGVAELADDLHVQAKRVVLVGEDLLKAV